MSLNTNKNIARPDDFYQVLIDAHRNLSEEESLAVNARLVLLLANHIGDMDTLKEAINLASNEPTTTKNGEQT